MLHYQEGAMVLLQDGPQLGRKAKALLTFSSIELRYSRLRTPERMPVIKRILNCWRWGLPFGARSISSGATSTLERLGEQGDGGQELDFHR
jgi:hypothetical protein